MCAMKRHHLAMEGPAVSGGVNRCPREGGRCGTLWTGTCSGRRDTRWGGCGFAGVFSIMPLVFDFSWAGAWPPHMSSTVAFFPRKCKFWATGKGHLASWRLTSKWLWQASKQVRADWSSRSFNWDSHKQKREIRGIWSDLHFILWHIPINTSYLILLRAVLFVFDRNH